LQSRQELLAGAIEVAEWSLRRKNGMSLPVEVSATILPDGRWHAIVRDISERKRAQDKLHDAQQRVELALRGADLGTWDWNIEVHGSRRADHHRSGTPRRRGRFLGRRHRTRHRTRGRSAPLRSLLARAQSQAAWGGARASNRQGHRREAQGPNLGGEFLGQGEHILLYDTCGASGRDMALRARPLQCLMIKLNMAWPCPRRRFVRVRAHLLRQRGEEPVHRLPEGVPRLSQTGSSCRAVSADYRRPETAACARAGGQTKLVRSSLRRCRSLNVRTCPVKGSNTDVPVRKPASAASLPGKRGEI
jgi:hypothetical protein